MISNKTKADTPYPCLERTWNTQNRNEHTLLKLVVIRQSVLLDISQTTTVAEKSGCKHEKQCRRSACWIIVF